MKIPNASGAVVVCGKCTVPLELHPVKTCPYLYRAVRFKTKVVGYMLTRK